MRVLSLDEIQAVSGANEADIVINGFGYAVMGYSLAMGMGFEPFYPTLVSTLYGIASATYVTIQNQND